MRPSHVLHLATVMAAARQNLLLTGPPGVGKSDLVAQACREAGVDVLVSHPAVADPTDFKGMPWVWSAEGSTRADFVPFADFHRALTAPRPLVWFFDDLGQASPSVQAAIMQLLLARRVNTHVLPNHVSFMAATNHRTDRAGVSQIIEPVKSRFVTIVEVEPHLEDWCAWAYAHAIHPAVIAFVRLRPDLLCAFQPSPELTQSPTPRAWVHVSRLLTLGLPAPVQTEAIRGAVGLGAAMEVMAFLQAIDTMPEIDRILAQPEQADMPQKLDVRFAVVSALAARATPEHWEAIAIYAERLERAGHGEFAVLLLRDVCRRYPDLILTPTFERLSAGPLGQLITA